MADTYLLIATTAQADQDNAGGGPLVRTVTVGAQTKAVICHFQYPWSEANVTAKIPKASLATGIPENELVAVGVTQAQYASASDQVYGAIRAANQAAREARAVELRAKATTLLDSLGFSPSNGARKEEIKALIYALKTQQEAYDNEVGGEL